MEIYFIDFDGTLADTNESNYLAYKESFKNVLNFDLDKNIWNKYNGWSTKDMLIDIGIYRDGIKRRIYQYKDKIYPVNYLDKIRINYELLKEKNIENCAICSNTDTYTIKTILLYNQIKFHDTNIISRDCVKNVKPSTEIFHLALSKFNTKEIDKIIIYEDSPIGIETATSFSKEVSIPVKIEKITFSN